MIAWLDVETTGLDPADGHLLEVGVILTDDELIEQHRTRVVIAPPTGAVVVMDATVKAMHEDNGLWAECRSGLTLPKADEVLAHWMDQLAPEKPVMAGSTVGFDRKWIEAKLPQFAARFHYRSIDVSSLKELNRRLKFGTEWNNDRKTHRALDDIEDSIRELTHYLYELGLLDTDADGTDTVDVYAYGSETPIRKIATMEPVTEESVRAGRPPANFRGCDPEVPRPLIHGCGCSCPTFDDWSRRHGHAPH